MDRDELLYLRHILDAIHVVEEYLRGVDEEKFKDTRLLQDGVIRQLEIIGEAVRHVSPNFRDLYPEIPWRDIAGMRSRLIHGYFGVDLDEVWSTTRDDLRPLHEQIKNILDEIDQEI